MSLTDGLKRDIRDAVLFRLVSRYGSLRTVSKQMQTKINPPFIFAQWNSCLAPDGALTKRKIELSAV
jgi:hypothetical protein